MIDRFSFWFSSRNSFQGAKSIVMQTSIVLDQISGGREQKSLRGAPPVEESQALDSTM